MIKIRTQVLFFAVLMITISACSTRKEYFRGYVFSSENNRPIANVLVLENFRNDGKHTITDSMGFFKLANKSTLPDLIFKKEGYQTDTVKTVWSQSGERLMYRFLNKKLDTIFLKKLF